MSGERSILVTGGAGFIGSHLVERLVLGGHRVAVVDDFSTGTEENLKPALYAGLSPGMVFRDDIVHSDLQAIVDSVRPDTIVHLAAQGQVAASMRDPLRDASVNVLGSVKVLNAARRGGVRRVVLSSSGGTIYGAASRAHELTDETDARIPHSFYGLSKAAADEYARLYGRHYGLDCVSLALGNVYGPRQNPHGEAGVLAILAHRLVTGQACVITGDGSAERDYVHVIDVVDAFVRALHRGSGVLNIGTGVGTSVIEAYRLLAERARVSTAPVFVPRPAGEVDRVVLDCARAARELGWRPAISLAEGLDGLLAWARSSSRADAVSH